MSLSDKMASGMVRFARYVVSSPFAAGSLIILEPRKLFDLVSGYKHKPIPLGTNMTVDELRKEGYVMTEVGWMNVSGQHTPVGTRSYPSTYAYHSDACSWRLLQVFQGWSRRPCDISTVYGFL